MNPESTFYSVVNGDLPPSQAGTLLGWRFVEYDDALRRIHVEFDAGPMLTNPMGNVQEASCRRCWMTAWGRRSTPHCPPTALRSRWNQDQFRQSGTTRAHHRLGRSRAQQGEHRLHAWLAD